MCPTDHKAFDNAYRRVGLVGLDAAVEPLKVAAAKRLTDDQRAFHAAECDQQSLVNDRVMVHFSDLKFAKVNQRRAEERAKLERKWRQAEKSIDSLSGFFPMAVVLGGESDRMTGAEVYALYENWCKAEDIKCVFKRNSLYAALAGMGVGITKSKQGVGVVLRGVRRTSSL
jgi:hypothetical protein